MRVAPLTRYRLRQVVAVTLFWVAMGVVIETNNALIYDVETGRYVLYFPFGANPMQHYFITALGPLIGGIFGGGLILFVLRDALRRRSFMTKLVIQSGVFLVLIFLLVMLVGSVQALRMSGPFGDRFVEVVFTWRVLRLMITWFVVVILTLVVLDVSEKYGKGMLPRIIMGKYHQPVIEKRFFMFLDLKESTRLTEILGDEKYFRLLRRVFYMCTEPVLNCEGEIYQYVGDEIIIHWTEEAGLRSNNCLQCYYAITETIRKDSAEFLHQFGVVPEFKAALHLGSAVIGEIGVIKKDIVFSGDVLNSTSRMLNHAKDRGVSFVASDNVHSRFADTSPFEFRFIESLILRGKTSPNGLYEVIRKPDC